MLSDKTKSLLGLGLVIALFAISSYFVRTNIGYIKGLVGDGISGLLVYFAIIIIAIVIAPISMMPLIPVISNLYGWFFGGIITYLGWVTGSMLVFIICRAYGVDLVKKLVSLDGIRKFESKIPKEDVFMDIVFLRMIVPVDILSYVLGLFSKVGFKTYLLATMAGLIPFTFVWSYLGTVSFFYQMIGFAVVVLLIAAIHIFREMKRR
jgi:uncharacterized membrane protein YdjX (TVP38/TMEM64 family)